MSVVLNEISALTSRELKRWYRQRYAIVFTLITPLFWLALFGKSFNLGNVFVVPPELIGELPSQIVETLRTFFDDIIVSVFGTKDYFTFMASGMLSILVLFTSMWSGMSIVWDRRFGFLNKLLAAPISTTSIVLSRVASTVVRGMIQVMLIFTVAVAIGLSLGAGFSVLNLLGIFSALALLSVGLSSVFVAMAFSIESHETMVAMANMINLPLMFASNALFPLDQMPDWLQAIAHVNPITYTVSTVRGLVLNSIAGTDLLYNLGVLGTGTFVFSVVGILIAHRILNR
jgi:ABC-2 type transport system permease protein